MIERYERKNTCPEGASPNNSYMNKLSKTLHIWIGIFKNMEVITLTER